MSKQKNVARMAVVLTVCGALLLIVAVGSLVLRCRTLEFRLNEMYLESLTAHTVEAGDGAGYLIHYAETAMKNANLLLQEAIAKREQLEERLEEEKRRLQEDISDSLNVREIRERENAVEIFRMYVRQQILVVMQREKEVEVAREHLNEAMKERKTFEKLREHAFEKFRLEENLREQKEVDELVSYRYGTDSD